MAIPDYQSLMLPILKISEDGGSRRHSQYVDLLSKEFQLSEAEMAERLPSNRPKFPNRVSWAIIHLYNAKVLDRTPQAPFSYKITQRGLELLKSKPSFVGLEILNTFPEYLEFKSRSSKRLDDKNFTPSFENQTTSITILETPEEAIEQAHDKLRNTLAIELLSKVKSIAPNQFEQLVVELLLKMGYGGSREDAGQVTGKTGDGGIDGVIKEDRLGLDVIYVQAKRWQGTVGRPEIQNFVGALAGHGAKKGVFITTSTFSKDARDYQPKNEIKIVLIDGDQLADLMIDYNLGVSVVTTYEVKRMDSDYFGED
jgi:restriction system protein